MLSPTTLRDTSCNVKKKNLLILFLFEILIYDSEKYSFFKICFIIIALYIISFVERNTFSYNFKKVCHCVYMDKKIKKICYCL